MRVLASTILMGLIVIPPEPERGAAPPPLERDDPPPPLAVFDPRFERENVRVSTDLSSSDTWCARKAAPSAFDCFSRC